MIRNHRWKLMIPKNLTVKKVVLYSGVALVGLLTIATIGGSVFLYSTVPSTKGSMKAQGIHDEIEILRDSYGMAHIYAKSDEDAGFALGYAMMQDRMFQMELIRRAISGRLSEVLGEDLLDIDRFFLTISAGKDPAEIYRTMNPDIKKMVAAFSRGVNLALEREPLPPEFHMLGFSPEPWTPEDSASIIYYMSWEMNVAFSSEVFYSIMEQKLGKSMADDLFPPYLDQGDRISDTRYPVAPPVIPANMKDDSTTAALHSFLTGYEKAGDLLGMKLPGASNNWAVSPRYTRSGRPLISGDMHLNFSLPTTWYEAHIVTPEYNVSGLLVAGSPLIIAGANMNVAWTYTNVQLDDADFYLEKTNPENPDQVEYAGKWENVKIKDVEIPVSGKSPVKYRIRITRNGPIINDIHNNLNVPGDGETAKVAQKLKETPISMRWALYDNFHTPLALFKVMRSRNVDEVHTALKDFRVPGINWVYADVDGNIAFTMAAAVPVRTGHPSMGILPGWDPKYTWKGFVPHNQLPHEKNPERGWIATANNPQSSLFKHDVSRTYSLPHRYRRIRMLLEKRIAEIDAKRKEGIGPEKTGFTMEEFQTMLADQKALWPGPFVKVLLEDVKKSQVELSPIEKEALDELKNWDLTTPPESVPTAIFHRYLQVLAERIYEPHMDKEFYDLYMIRFETAFQSMLLLIRQPDSVWFDNPKTSEKEDRTRVNVESFRKAVALLQKNPGGGVKNWQWSRIHSLTLHHTLSRAVSSLGTILDRGPYTVGGTVSVVNPMTMMLNESLDAFQGVSQRYIHELGKPDKSLRVIPGGISGNFMSPHYDDQIPLFLENRYRPFVLTREAVEKDVESRMVLKPENH